MHIYVTIIKEKDTMNLRGYMYVCMREEKENDVIIILLKCMKKSLPVAQLTWNRYAAQAGQLMAILPQSPEC